MLLSSRSRIIFEAPVFFGESSVGYTAWFPYPIMLLSKYGGDICRRKQNIQVVTELELMITESELSNE